MKKLIILISVCLFASSLSAEWSEQSKIDKLDVRDWGIVVYLETGVNNVDNCVSSIVYSLQETEAYFKEKYAMLLAAKTSAKEVSIYSHGCYANNNYAKVSVVRVHD